MSDKNKKLLVVQNAGLLELERIVANLYAKDMVSKDEIKELINSLKMMVDILPEQKQTYIH